MASSAKPRRPPSTPAKDMRLFRDPASNNDHFQQHYQPPSSAKPNYIRMYNYDEDDDRMGLNKGPQRRLEMVSSDGQQISLN